MIRRMPSLVAAAALGLGLAACEPSVEPAEPSAEAAEARPAGGEVVAARVAGEPVTLDELDAWIKDDLFRRSTGDGDAAQVHELRRTALDNMIDQQLLAGEAERRGVSSEALLQSEVEKRMEVSDEEVANFYEENKERVDAPLEEIAPRIRQHLESQEGPRAAREYLASLRQEAQVEVLLETPRTEVAATGPSRGAEGAPVTIVEFSDFQCPFCQRADPTVRQVLEAYPDQVRVVYRHFPLDRIHPEARGAAEAAACAAEQGKFWEFHDRLFSGESQLDEEGLRNVAQEMGLDTEAFGQCLESDATRALVEADVEAGRTAGVTGTPAFFVNGIKLTGARPFEDFAEVIDQELAKAGVEPARDTADDGGAEPQPQAPGSS